MDKSNILRLKGINFFKLILKIAVTIGCLWYLSGKIDFQKAKSALKSAEWVFLLLAIVAYFLSKLISANRLNYYFANINIYIPSQNNVKLYWLGMFYNLFLPGSISGDAYKVILLANKYKVSYKKTTTAILLDRISGLLGLGLLLASFSLIVLEKTLYISLILSVVFIAGIIFFLIIKKFFHHFIRSFIPTLILGITVQILQVVCIYMILIALNIRANEHQYIFIFLVSSIVSVLPLTIGGLGIREVVFFECSAYFGIVQETSVVISILFYLITALTSAVGLYFIFSDPLKQKIMDSNRVHNL